MTTNGLESKDSSKQSQTPPFVLPGFPNDEIPEHIVLTEHAKEVFLSARPFEKSYPNGQKLGQGMVGIAWLGKDENDHDMLYLDLMPAFNKDDGRPRSNKYGQSYKEGEYVYTNEPLGGNSGRNHDQFITIIQKRIQSALDSGDKQILKKYSGCYSVNNNKVNIDKSKLFGFGIFKKEVDNELYEFRSVSANINFESVKWSREYLLCFYFDTNTDINDPFQLEYYLRRPMPSEVALKIEGALKKNVLQDTSMDSFFRYPKNVVTAQNEWLSIRNDPKEKIKYLYETLCKFADSNSAKLDEIKEVVFWIKHNIALIERDPILQQARLKVILERPSEYNNKNVFEIALSHKYHGIIDYFEDQVQIDTDNIIDFERIQREENNQSLTKTVKKEIINYMNEVQRIIDNNHNSIDPLTDEEIESYQKQLNVLQANLDCLNGNLSLKDLRSVLMKDSEYKANSKIKELVTKVFDIKGGSLEMTSTNLFFFNQKRNMKLEPDNKEEEENFHQTKPE